jgi:hypothetical protein
LEFRSDVGISQASSTHAVLDVSDHSQQMMAHFEPVLLVLVGILSCLWRQCTIQAQPSTLQRDAYVGWLSWTLAYLICRSRTWRQRSVLSIPSPTVTIQSQATFSQSLSSVLPISATVLVAQIAQSRGALPMVTVCRNWSRK